MNSNATLKIPREKELQIILDFLRKFRELVSKEINPNKTVMPDIDWQDKHSNMRV